jgi:hypothetical protein
MGDARDEQAQLLVGRIGDARDAIGDAVRYRADFHGGGEHDNPAAMPTATAMCSA